MNFIKITGTLIKNYFHCKRQAYLYYYGLNFKNELTMIGEIMHKQEKAKEYVFEKIKIDDIKDNTLIELKKSSANLKGTKFQVLYYLKYLKEKGLKLKRLIKDITFGVDYIVELTKEKEIELDNILNEIEKLLNGAMPPVKKLKKNCKGCSFFDYCRIK